MTPALSVRTNRHLVTGVGPGFFANLRSARLLVAQERRVTYGAKILRTSSVSCVMEWSSTRLIWVDALSPGVQAQSLHALGPGRRCAARPDPAHACGKRVGRRTPRSVAQVRHPRSRAREV